MHRVVTPSKRSRIARSLGRASATTLASLAALPAAAQNQLWVRQLGTSATDQLWAAAPDSSGGIFVGGNTSGSLVGTNAGAGDAWLARYDGAGSQVWIRQLGTSANDEMHAAAPDGSGGTYVGGHTGGSLGGPTAGYRDAWLARYGSAGNSLWIRQIGTSKDDEMHAAAPDSSGGLFVGGHTYGSLGGTNSGFSTDAWFARYDGAGNQLWIRQLGTDFEDEIQAAAPDGSGGVFVGGYSNGSLGGPSAFGSDAWLARYDGNGGQLWIRQFGTSNHDRIEAATADGSGGVYVSGWTYGSLGGPNAGGSDAWLGRYDGAGNKLWIRQLGSNQLDFALTAHLDGAGGVYVGGDTWGDLGRPNWGDSDVWLARYDDQGNPVGILHFGVFELDSARAAVPDGAGGSFVGGYTRGSLGAPNAGSHDAWLARYEAPCGASAVYCTAKTTSTGCTPAIGSVGTPSKSGGPGSFDVTLSGTRPNKPHICFYSVNTARSSAPFQGGFLCTTPPLRRTAVEITSNAGECTSGASKDFGAILANASFISAGDVLRGEWWGRDTPGNSSLSDAIELTVCP